MPANNLLYYLKSVQREAGMQVSASFPANPDDQQQRCLDKINGCLRYLNQKYYLAFKYTEYILTTTPGVSSYNLNDSPYSQAGWRVNRLARNAVVRVTDEYALDFIDYAGLDDYRPAHHGNSLSVLYSSTGDNLILYPKPNGEQYKIRYYGVHIGTDSTGTVNKNRLTAADDLTMLQDEYEDALVCMAVAGVRLRDGVDDKYLEYKKKAEDWEKILYDMSQPGEDATPAMLIKPFRSWFNNMERYAPFGTDWEQRY